MRRDRSPLVGPRLNPMRLKLVELGDSGVVVTGRRVGQLTIPYPDLLTAERLRSRSGLALHTRTQIEPMRVRCRRSQREAIENELRFMDVRIVDWWGAIIAPTLLDFEAELARDPVELRQSSDDA